MIAKTATVDADGVKNETDTFGYIADFTATDAFYQGSGLKQLTTGADGSVMISSDMSSQKAGGIMEDLLTFLDTPAAAVRGSFSFIPAGGKTVDALWAGNQALFYHNAISEALNARAFDVGVLPNPKYDEEQENYLTTPGFWYHMWGVARGTTSEFEDLCAIMEALASEGYRKTVPLYFDTMLAERQETANDYDMLQIIRAGVVIDGGRVMDNAFETNTWSIWRRCIMNERDYLAYYAEYATRLPEQATTLNSLVRNMEKLYG